MSQYSCKQSDRYPAALCVYSSDDYYEYGHSGESYDSYGEFAALLPLMSLVSVIRKSMFYFLSLLWL